MPAKEVDPEGGESKAAKSWEEGHCAREVHVPMEHCCLGGVYIEKHREYKVYWEIYRIKR